jgi:hypothetical protein
LLGVMVALVAFVGLTKASDGHWTDNWQYVGRPFLISTVALGGAMNTLPVIYSKVHNSSPSLILYR